MGDGLQRGRLGALIWAALTVGFADGGWADAELGLFGGEGRTGLAEGARAGSRSSRWMGVELPPTLRGTNRWSQAPSHVPSLSLPRAEQVWGRGGNDR